MRALRHGALLGACLLVLVGCEQSRDPEKVGAQFVDSYYIRVDLADARRWTEGVATEKIDEQLRLTHGVRVEGTRAMREVSYRVVEKKRSEGERVILVFELTVKAPGSGSFRKRSLITLGKGSGGWRVTNFRDFDA